MKAQSQRAEAVRTFSSWESKLIPVPGRELTFVQIAFAIHFTLLGSCPCPSVHAFAPSFVGQGRRENKRAFTRMRGHTHPPTLV